MKRILLVNPHESDQAGFTNPPLGLLYIAGALLKNNIEVQIIDGCFEGKPSILKAISEFKPQLVGVTCLTPERKKSFEVAQMVKDYDPRIKVILGGAHATIMYKQILENYSSVDYVVIGEGEQTCLEIVQGLEPSKISGLAYRENEKIVKTAPRHYVENLDDLPFPAWQLIDLSKYPARGEGIVRGINLAKETRVSVIFSRGCKGHCDFCSTWWIWKGWRHRSAKNMADEIEWLYKDFGVRHFNFADDAMTVDRQATIELCDEIINRNVQIVFNLATRTDCVDEVLLGKLKDAGCYGVSYGIETGSPAILEKMGKENNIKNSELAIQMTKKLGLIVTALIMVGNMGENEQTVEETRMFLKKTDPDIVGCLGGVWILPGTKLYQACKKQGFIDDDFWLSDEPYKLYTLENTLEELKAFGKRISFYNFDRRLKNIFDVVKNDAGNVPKLILTKIKNTIWGNSVKKGR